MSDVPEGGANNVPSTAPSPERPLRDAVAAGKLKGLHFKKRRIEEPEQASTGAPESSGAQPPSRGAWYVVSYFSGDRVLTFQAAAQKTRCSSTSPRRRTQVSRRRTEHDLPQQEQGMFWSAISDSIRLAPF